jgi:hypothetical protein
MIFRHRALLELIVSTKTIRADEPPQSKTAVIWLPDTGVYNAVKLPTALGVQYIAQITSDSSERYRRASSLRTSRIQIRPLRRDLVSDAKSYSALKISLKYSDQTESMPLYAMKTNKRHPSGLILAGIHVALASVFLALFTAGTLPYRAGAAAPDSAKGVYYVATNGNDRWSGTLARPNPAGSDGPFASLARARDAVRSIKREQGGPLKQPITVMVRGGTHFLQEPVVFTSEDSGSEVGRVNYEGYPGEVPIISGGRRISGWQPRTIGGRSLWAADISAARGGRWFFHELWVDGQRRVRARHPNHGYLAVAEVPEVKADAPWTEGQSRFRFKEGDLKGWSTVTNAEVCVMNRWVESHLPVVNVDEANRLVTFAKRSVFKLDPGDLYYIDNALELLDTPGEWYLDPAAGTLYYMPMPGEDMKHVDVIAPVLTQVVRFEGKAGAGQFVEHLNFDRLVFSHTEWYFPGGFAADRNKPEISPAPKPEVGGFGQAAIGVPGAVWGQGVRHCTFIRCQFVHIGNYALELARGCQHNRIVMCEAGDLGAGGLKLGETGIQMADADIARDNEVSDCHVHDGGLIFHSAIGVWIGQSPGNRLVRNEINDFYYTGISMGWTWGYGPALATNNLVEFNHVHHIGVRSDGDGPILSDMAGIYTLGLHQGSVIRNNLWHDFAGFRYGGWGIYFDEGTTGIVAENNIVYRSTHGGFHQHYGKDNLVRNNIFAYARDQQLQRSRVEEHRSFTFERNIVLWNQGALLGGNFSGTNYLFQSNLYWREGGGEIKFDKWPFDEWQKRGEDKGSLIADPGFVDPQHGDFTFKPGSPAAQIGFQPINLKDVGVRPNPTK